MIKLKKTKIGMIIAGIYLLLSVLAFLTHIISVKTNPADSGLSALWFYLCALPWMQYLMNILPKEFFYTRTWSLLCYPIGWICVFINVLILYCLSGGMKWERTRREK